MCLCGGGGRGTLRKPSRQMTSKCRRTDVITSHRRQYDEIAISCLLGNHTIKCRANVGHFQLWSRKHVALMLRIKN